jgi:hypothetical protein
LPCVSVQDIGQWVLSCSVFLVFWTISKGNMCKLWYDSFIFHEWLHIPLMGIRISCFWDICIHRNINLAIAFVYSICIFSKVIKISLRWSLEIYLILFNHYFNLLTIIQSKYKEFISIFEHLIKTCVIWRQKIQIFIELQKH